MEGVGKVVGVLSHPVIFGVAKWALLRALLGFLVGSWLGVLGDGSKDENIGWTWRGDT